VHASWGAARTQGREQQGGWNADDHSEGPLAMPVGGVLNGWGPIPHLHGGSAALACCKLVCSQKQRACGGVDAMGRRGSTLEVTMSSSPLLIGDPIGKTCANVRGRALAKNVHRDAPETAGQG
jgi:hypothetical protein